MAGTADDVAMALETFFTSANQPILFTGAGASMLAGLPDWKGLLNRLGEAIKAKDPATAFQIQTYAAKGSLTRAADFFWITDEVVDAVKHDILKSLLRNYQSKPLEPLASLPFVGAITTNFDRSILDAIAAARGRTPVDYVFGDSRFIQATFEQDLFVARIHGAAESPGSIILSESQFRTILKDDAYLDVLSENLLHRSMLFLGFSFYDPAIRFVFERLEKRFGHALPGRHVALLPDDNAAELLITKAARLNLAVIKYDSSNHHAALWEGVSKFARSLKKAVPRPIASATHPYAVTKQYLAACYARASVAAAHSPLRETITEGILSALIQAAHPKGLLTKELYEGVRKAIGVKGEDIEQHIDAALKSLVDGKLVRKHRNPDEKGAKYAWSTNPDVESTLDQAIQFLRDSVATRAYASLGWKPSNAVLDVVTAVLKEVIHRRGWDLGAAFAAGRSPDPVVFRPLVMERGAKLPTFDRQRLEQVLESLFLTPTVEEGKILGELGRVSFALELAFQAPRTTLFHRTTLPKRIYFDANFLMPALVEWHPHYNTYQKSLSRILEASSKAGTAIQLISYYGYLNEIISHRNLALTYAKEAGEDFDMVLRSDAMFHGPGNINVFLGGYINARHNGFATDFEAYLNTVAPYSREAELRRWLDTRGILVVDGPKASPYPDIYAVLERANAGKLAKTDGGKEPILVEHDALQMTLLEADRRRSERALFVTADRQLFEDINASSFSSLCEFMVSNVGLVQLVDVLVGLDDGDRALGDLLWSNRLSERNSQVRAYLMVEALSKYDAGMEMNFHDAVEKQADEVVKELQRRGQSLDAHEPKARVKAFRSLNALESDFFSRVAAKKAAPRSR